METFEKLYTDQIDLLKQKGYDQHSQLVTTEFLGTLLYRFLEAYQNSRRTNQPNVFYVSTKGSFDKVPEPIKIVFHYQYSPTKKGLTIDRLFVTMKEVRSTFHLHSNSDLPNPNTIFEEIARQYEMHPQKKADDFWEAFENHKTLLIERGFDSTGLNNQEPIEKFMDRILEGFKTALLQNIALKVDPLSFSVETKGYFNLEADIVNFKFNYKYDSKTVSLTLDSLAATMGETKTYYLDKDADLPHSSMVHNYFYQNFRLINQIVPALNNQYGTGKMHL